MMMIDNMGRDDFDFDLNLNELPLGFDDDSISAVKQELKQAMLEHEIIFKNQVHELHRLYWNQKNLMNEVCMRMPFSSSTSRRDNCREFREELNHGKAKSCLNLVQISEERGSDVRVAVDNSVRDSTGNVAGVFRGLKEYGCDESIACNDQSVKIRAGGELEANKDCRNDYLNVHPVIGVEGSLALKASEEASTSRSSGFRMLGLENADMDRPRDSVLSDFDSVSRLRRCSHSVLLLENSPLVSQSREELPGNSALTNAGLYHSSGSLSSTVLTQRQQPTHKILQIDLNLSLDEEFANCFSDHMQEFTSLPTCSPVVYNKELSRELSSKKPEDSLPSSQCPETRITIDQPHVVLNGLENMSRYMEVHSQQDFLDDSELSYRKEMLVSEVCKSTVENLVECCRTSVETCPSISNGGTQTSTNVATFPLTASDEPQMKSVAAFPSWSDHNAESLSSKQASRETSINDIDNFLHDSILRISKAKNKEKQPLDTGSDEDTLSSHAINDYVVQLDELDSSVDEHKPDKVGNSRSSIGKKSASLSLKSMPNAKLLVGPKSNNLVSERILVKHATALEASDSVFIHNQTCMEGVAEPHKHIVQQALSLELEHTVQKAAETLTLFRSANTTSSNYMCSVEDAETESNIGDDPESNIGDDPESNIDNGQPQLSFDSFEKLTLELEEIKDDGNSIPDCQLHIETRSNACVMNLRRGRGRGRSLRDFQKDILPGLVSLSRHEICEDIQTIKYQIKKNGCHKDAEETLPMPVRSRRLRSTLRRN